MFKKILSTSVILFVAGISTMVYAEGYQVNTLSTRQLGMGHTGVAQHLDGESMYFNPAGLGFMKSTFNVSGSFTSIFSKAQATLPDGDVYKTVSDPSTPIMFNAAFSIYDNLKAGVAFYTPYGSGIDWTDNWPGAVMSQRVALKMFALQPTVSWRITDRLSVGVGLTVNWGSVNLHKGLVDPSTADKMVGLLAQLGQLSDPQYYGTVMPASIVLDGKSGVSCGFNIGAMYDVTDNLTVGASFRSKVQMKVDAGHASIDFANDQARVLLNELHVLNSTNFAASMPCPYVFSFGASYKPVGNVTVAVDARLTGWKTYKKLDIEFLDPLCAAYNQSIAKNYRNSWAVSMGAEWNVTKRFDARLGLMVDTSPVNNEHYNPETPGMTKVEPTLGFSFKPFAGFSIDFAFMYVAGMGRDNATCSYPDLLASKLNKLAPALALPETKTFEASYKAHAFIPSVGLSYSF